MKSEQLEINPAIFREYDIRGIAGRDLSADFARILGRAYGHYLQEETGKTSLRVAVGRDCRLTSGEYASYLIDGIRDMGIDVISIGVCPSPLTYYGIIHYETDGGIMVTGSHNPPDYNGFKICIGRDTIHGDQIQHLKKLVFNDSILNMKKDEPRGTLVEKEIIPYYIEYLVDHFKGLKNKKIVLDAGNGTAATVAPPLFDRLGAEVIPLFCELDGRFPNHHPDPTVLKNLEDLIAKVKETGADFGVAFDGDSDRIGLIDEKGRPFFGDELMVILARAVLKQNPGATIISEVKSSNRLYEDINKRGGNGIMWKTGHSLIKSKMKETGAALAGEMSGHIFFADRYFGFDDAIYAALRVYEIASATDEPLSTWLSDLPPAVATPEIRVECDEAKKFELVTKTRELLKAQNLETNDIDGVRVNFGDSWGLVRASNTQPVLVLRFEAPSEARLKEVRGIVEDSLKKAAEQLNHGELHI